MLGKYFISISRGMHGAFDDVCDSCQSSRSITHLVELRRYQPLAALGYTRPYVMAAVCTDCAQAAVVNPLKELALIKSLRGEGARHDAN